MPQEITIDFSEQIAKVQTKIARLKDMIHDVRDQKIVLDDIKIIICLGIQNLN